MSLGGRGRGPGFPARGPKARLKPSQLVAPTGQPFTPLDFPPLPLVRDAGGVTVTASLLLTTLAVVTTAVTREPLYHTLPRQPVPFDYPAPNLLPLKFPPILAPLMPVPMEEALPPQNFRPTEVQLNLLTSTLKSSQAAPFAPVDLSGPAAPQQVPTWMPQRNLLLTAVPFRPLDFPIQRALTYFPFDPPNLLTSTLAPQQAAPFIPVDFSGLQKAPGPQPYVPADVLTGVLLGQTIPFNQLSWPGLTPSRLAPQEPAGANLALLTTPQPQPFNQLDWPGLAKPISPEPFLIPNTTIRQVAAPAPPNLHKLYYDVSSGRLFWRVSKTANPIEIIPL